MKTKITLSIFFFLVTLSLHAQSLVGKWHGDSQGEVGTMTFDKDGYVTFIMDGEKLGGKKFISEGVELSMRYELNNKVEPNTLDLILMSGDETIEFSRMLGIYKFINAKTLLINMDFEGKSRPLEFDDDDANQIELKRIKGKS